MTDHDDRIGFTVDSTTKKAAQADLDHGELSEKLRNYVHKMAFGEDVSRQEQIEQRIEEVSQEMEEHVAQRRHHDAEVDRLAAEKDRLEEDLQTLTSRDEQYEATLKLLEEALADGRRVFPGHGQVEQAAMIGDTPPEEVIEDLKERNPSYPDERFIDGLKLSHSTDPSRNGS
jgi:DNA repair exonuclease SbcCD ATPase subunit